MPNRVSIVKNLLEQSLKIVVGFAIFEIAQKTKKLLLQSIKIGTPRGPTVGVQGCLEVTRGSLKDLHSLKNVMQPSDLVLGLKFF